MTINEMKDKVIGKWGFEHDATIYFFQTCEDTDDIDIIETAYWFAIDWIEDEEI